MQDERHLMIDLETLDTSPTAVVTSVALVVFNPFSDAVTEQFSFQLDVQEQLDTGGTVSASTLQFWMSQMQVSNVSPADVVPTIETSLFEREEQLLEWLGDHGEFDGVWAQGINFDLPVLKSLFPNVELCDYNKVRDSRTLINECKRFGFEAPGRVGKHHDPVDDCITQIRRVQAAYTFLEGLTALPAASEEHF